ncbi:MAG: hypothetical protein FJY17_01140 [Bacteroidetes bacterium]|nr:hypothetical protein [Bacteroidota bacterium]
MPIPQNITRTHILDVIDQINQGRQIPNRRNLRKVALRINRRNYPVKILISWGYEIATGQELEYNLFVTQEATAYLRNLGFNVGEI